MDRVCNVCGFTKNLEKDFYRDSSRTGKREYRCKACSAKQRREALTRQIAARVALVALLKQEGCVVCGENDPLVIEFHHIDEKLVIGASKGSIITKMVYGAHGEAVFLKEVAKCVPVCANDHKRIHAGAIGLDTVPRYSVEWLSEQLREQSPRP